MTWAARVMLVAIEGYRLALAPVLGRHCRFAPTCSDYARQAVAAHGAAKGAWLAARRVLRCHPFHPGGFDPPPPVKAREA
ncbi:MAG: membrane protein insertion efficiency factor YidD [Candidatus Rokuibacteriota bacterium]